MSSARGSVRESTGAGPANDEDPFTDEELGALALAAAPDQAVGADAIPWEVFVAGLGGPLPSWYMPPSKGRLHKRWQKSVVFAIIATFLVIDALGLCSTYGPLVPA